jgi:hypothetical protein
VIYADANVVIRLIEGDAATRAPLEARLLPLRELFDEPFVVDQLRPLTTAEREQWKRVKQKRSIRQAR